MANSIDLKMDVFVRLETPADYAAVEALARDAFWNQYFPGCDEHYTAHVMRSHPDFIPELTFVAELDGRIVGSIMFTRSWLTGKDGARKEIVTFGPLCVAPALQRRGIGTALIRHSLSLAKARGADAVVILGDPHNYCVHGFRNGKDLGVSDREGRYPIGLLVKELREGALGGGSWQFKYSEVYDIDAEAAAAFDAKLPPRPKEWRSSQEVFSMLVRARLD